MAQADNEKKFEAKLIVETIQDVPTYYVNHAEIAAGQHDCSIWFVRVPVVPDRRELDDIQEAGEYRVEPDVQLVIPFSLVDGLVNALEKTKGLIEQQIALRDKGNALDN